MGQGTIHSCYLVLCLLLLSLKYVVCTEFQTEACPSLPDEEGVLSKMKEFTGRSEESLMRTRQLADIMHLRADPQKTWASNLTLDQYILRDQSGVLPFRNPPRTVDSTRLTYPDGECSGWGKAKVVTTEPGRTKEKGVKEAGDRARSYIQNLVRQIDRFQTYIRTHCNDPRGSPECAGTYYSTHAELKLFASLVCREQLESPQTREEALVFAVSREVCRSCRFILPFLMANSGRHLVTVSVRNGRRGVRGTIERKEYTYFDTKGNFISYLEGDGEFKCTKVTLANAPSGTFERVSPCLPTDTMAREMHSDSRKLKGSTRSELHTWSTKQLLKAYTAKKEQLGAAVVHRTTPVLPDPISCPLPICNVEELRICVAVFGSTNQESLCPGSEVMTGIHGSFGWHVRDLRHSLKSIGSICEASGRQRFIGVESDSKFTLECPPNFLLVGIGGCYGGAVDGITISCRSIIDGRYWTSGRYGYSTGGCCRMAECPDGLVVGSVGISYSNSEIRGMNMCCQ